MQSKRTAQWSTRTISPARAMIATLAGALSSGAHSDIYSNYVNENTHGYIVENMPDFDQRRTFLPNTGDCYCGPAAAADMMGYISTHGFPDVDPGIPATSWSDRADYNDMSRLLLDLGTGITEPGPRPDPCGTGMRDLRELLQSRVTYRFIVDSEVFNRSDPNATPPRFEDLSQRLARDNAIGISLAASYRGSSDQFWPASWPTNGVEDRLGGHYEAVNRAFVGPEVRRVGLRNPWSTDSPLTQSPFTTRFFDVQATELQLGARSVPVDVFGGPYEKDVDHDDDEDTPPIREIRVYIFEGYITLTPRWFMSWGEFSGTVERVSAVPEFEAPDALQDVLVHDGPVDEVAVGPKSKSIFSTCRGKLYRTVRGVDSTPREIDLPPNAPITGPIAFDDAGRLHAISRGRVVRLDPMSAEVLGVTSLPGEGSSITIAFGLVHVLVPEMGVVAVIDPETGSIVDQLFLPDDALAGADSTIAMLPNGVFILLDDGSLNPMRITSQGLERLPMAIPRDGDWAEMIVDVGDMVLLRDDRNLIEAHRITPQGFERLDEHAFDGLKVAGRLAIPPSTPDIAFLEDSAVFDERMDVEIVPDCEGDLDFNGKTDAADLGILLGEWGRRHSRADLDRNGLVDSADLGLLLGFFGDCN